MPNSFLQYEANGADTKTGIAIPTFKKEEIKVRVDGVLKTEGSGQDYEIENYTASSFDIDWKDSARPGTGSPSIVRVYRDTDILNNAETDVQGRVTYSAGSSVKATDLNNNQKQVLRSLEEQDEQKIQTYDIEDKAITSAKILDGTIAAADLATDSVTTAKIADGNVTMAKLPTGAVTLPGNISVTSSNLDPNSVTSANIINDSIVDADINSSAAIAGSKLQAASGSNAGSMSSAHYTKLEGVAAGAEVNVKSDWNSSSGDNEILNKPTLITLVDEDDFASNLDTKAPTQQSTKAYIQTYAEPKDAQLTTLAGMPSGTASILANAEALTSTTAKLNLLSDKEIVDSISGSATDVQLPTAQAVNERITTVVQDVGGFVPLANETSFPATNPDLNNGAGTLVSIKALASNLVSNGSGEATVTNGAGVGNDVTINGLANSTTYTAGKGLILETTTTLHTYSFHREALGSADISNAQTLVSDFNDRYQIAGSTPSAHPDSSALQEGDLWFDTGSDTMKVYDGSNYNAVTSTGDYKLLTVVPDGATSGSPDYTNVSFDLRDGDSAASITSVGQLIVSVDGVIQKPNSTTWSASNEGFHLEGSNGIKFCTAPGSGASVFVTQIGTATTVNVPATNSIQTGMIQTNQVSEEKLLISNTASDGQFLQYKDNTDKLTWADASSVGGATGVAFNDNVKAGFGGGNSGAGDLQIFHDHAGDRGDAGYNKIESAGAHLDIQCNNDIRITTPSTTNSGADSPEVMATFNTNGAVELSHNGLTKIATSDVGATITGIATATTFSGSGASLTNIPAANVTGTLPAIDGSNLTGIDAGAKGGGTNKIFWENEQTIDYNYTITNNHNAFTAGPVTIAATGNGDGSAVVVTIGSGENWTII